ncbi:phospholipid-translocating ATPase [Rhizophagus clarus]|uniref:Phospholipid-transporting ATPase n=1 Tax=Rhizophagus clarus TaxID=94130 RepID=A0A8H3L3Z6_9GLOM|nr:phospholipid-translocating ATPase [Rhizophagus clarus]
MFSRLKFWKPRKPQLNARQVYVNEPIPQAKLDKHGNPKQKYVSNEVLTSKYNIFTFIPKNLYEQFRRIANFFFLLLVVLQWFPEFATIQPIVAALPMFIILGITSIKDGFEDFKRHVTDRSVNNRKTWTLGNWKNVNYVNVTSNSFINLIISLFNKKTSVSKPVRGENPEWKETLFKDVRVGDFIKLHNDDFIPADIIILSTSEPNSLCYVETKNLDGETNLKIRSSVPETDHLTTPQDCAHIQFYVDSEPPTTNLFSYNATLVFPFGLPDRPRSRGGPIKVPINLNSMLLRGCVLKNTEWVIGLVVFTGTDTKLSLNSGNTPSKRSRIEKMMNPQVIANLAIMGLMCALCAVGSKIWETNNLGKNATYIEQGNRGIGLNAFLAFCNALIAFQNIVPISLYLSIEFVKSVQAFFIFMDDEMRYPETDTPCIPKNWNLSDDLGQIEYIFSDKTGTLTRNVMEFRKCSIGGKVYHGEVSGNDVENDTLTPSNDNGKSTPSLVSNTKTDSQPDIPKSGSSKKINEKKKEKKEKNENKPFTDNELKQDMTNSNHSKSINDFFTLLAICHTVLVNTNSDGEQQYKAQSPDEAALVQAAKDVGYTFRSRETDHIVITTPDGNEVHFELLNILEFTSSRKRMSIIVRSPTDGRITLFCKGADNVIFERLKSGQDYRANITGEHLEEFAKEGLRTLCLGYADIDPGFYQKWNNEFREASSSIVDRDKRVEIVSNRIEKDLILLGATAIEDRLQDGVPECIATLKRAGIKIWVLTGDKMETAISIGFSTCLLSRDMNLIIVRGGAYGESGSAYEQMRNAVEKFFPTDQDIQNNIRSQVPPVMSVNNAPRSSTSHAREMSLGRSLSIISGVSNSPRPGGHALIIDGVALKYALEEPWSKNLLLDLACRCKGVICCRVSPLQKAKVVELVKEGKNVMTCAIGDGANDVSMIQAAHIGIGVAGEEGLQAVMASDYAIAQFRYLTRLLLVHGHYAYIRNSSMILNFFYKNMIGVGTLFWYQFFCGYSTTIVFEYTYTLFWNLFFTCVAVLSIGVFDRDVPDNVATEVPELYKRGINREAYTMQTFLYYMLEGRTPDYLEMGTTMAVSCITMANLFTGFNAQCWTIFHFISVYGSIALILLYISVYSLIPFSDIYGFDFIVFGGGVFWFCVILTVFISMLPRYSLKYYQRNYKPTDVNIIQEIIKADPKHNFTSDPRIYRSVSLARQSTKESLYSRNESISPIFAEGGVFTYSARPSFATDRTNLDARSPTPPVPPIPPEYISNSLEVQDVPTSMTFMRTGLTEPMRGYAFSQEEGTGRIMAPPLKRRKTNPGPIGRMSRIEYNDLSLRRRSLPEVRASRDLIDILGEGEKIRMVHFRESTSTTNVTSRENSEYINEEHGIQSSRRMSGNESENEQVNENNNDDETQTQPIIEQEQSKTLDNNDKAESI